MDTLMQTPARRVRHACLITTATEGIAQCAEAAAGVYRPHTEGEPGQPVRVPSVETFADFARKAAAELDAAVTKDAARWPQAAERERREAEATAQRRAVLAEAESVLLGTDGPVPLPTPAQAAAVDLVGAGEAFLDAMRTGADALAVLARLTGDGSYGTAEIMDEAVRLAAGAACIDLQEAAGMEHPDEAAYKVMSAVRSLALVVQLASIDLD